MDIDLRFIWAIGLIFGLGTAILDLFVDFTFNPSQVFIGAAFIAITFDSFVVAKKDNNPFSKRHYNFIGFLTLVMTLLLFLIAMLQNTIIAFTGLFAVFILVALIGAVEMGMYSKLIPQVVYYEMLVKYADKIRKKEK